MPTSDDRSVPRISSVPWSSVAVDVTAERLLPEHMMHAINGTVVALCRSDPAGWMRHDDRTMFSLLARPPRARPHCLGFGTDW